MGAARRVFACIIFVTALEMGFFHTRLLPPLLIPPLVLQKSGIISGGASDLKAKARRWDEKR